MNTKRLCFALLLAMILSAIPVPSAEAAPYKGYNYNYWGEATPSPVPYLPSRVIDGKQLGIGHFQAPEDIFVAGDGTVYLLDSGNGRIVCMDDKWNVIRVIRQFHKDGKEETFNKPRGIFVSDSGHIFVADTENRRVIELTGDGTFVREIGEPKSDVIRQGFEYFPIKIALDKAKRIYVVGRGVFDGIMEFDADGMFTGFTGTNKVKFNPIDYFWKMVSTRAQREKMELFIPIEFNNLDLDEDGFIYTTTSEVNSNTPIQRLNPTGTDVLRREGYYNPLGDLEYSYVGDNRGGSVFVDIDVSDYGLYSALDSKKGRVFTYSDDGDLLYVFGQNGKQAGTFKTPVAIDRLGEQLIVVDRDLNRINVFEPTEFGRSVNEAVKQYYLGKEEQSAEAWKKVLKLNANYEIAYIGIGKALLRQGKNEEAMEYFHHGMSRKYYSKAYERYRKEVMREHFGTVMTCALIAAIAIIGFAYFRRSRKARRLSAHVH